MSNETIDLVVTSPPYDDLRDYNGYFFDFENISKELFRIIKPGRAIVWVVGDKTSDGSESGTSLRQAIHFMSLGFNLHDTMIFEKNTSSFPSGEKSARYTQIFEYMFVFSKGKLKTVNLIRDKKNGWVGTTTWGKSNKRRQDGTFKEVSMTGKKYAEFGVRNNIWRYVVSGGFGNEKEAYDHPATFPLELAEDHILSWSNENDLVYDPFMGSGTTAIASINTNRHWVGSETSKDYFDMAMARVSSHQKKSIRNRKVHSKFNEFFDS
jgi:site-specific DNA-methyltransferase (adenine-specific)